MPDSASYCWEKKNWRVGESQMRSVRTTTDGSRCTQVQGQRSSIRRWRGRPASHAAGRARLYRWRGRATATDRCAPGPSRRDRGPHSDRARRRRAATPRQSGSGPARERPADEARVARVRSWGRHRPVGRGHRVSAFMVERDHAAGKLPPARSGATTTISEQSSTTQVRDQTGWAVPPAPCGRGKSMRASSPPPSRGSNAK
jgi:hypothetical protein